MISADILKKVPENCKICTHLFGLTKGLSINYVNKIRWSFKKFDMEELGMFLLIYILGFHAVG